MKRLSVEAVQVDDMAEFWFWSTGLHQYAGTTWEGEG